MENDNKNKINSEGEIGPKEQTIKFKIYNYFYFILKDKKEINLASSCIFIFLEMIQLLSFGFADPHKKTWKINEDTMDKISTVVGALRIAPLMIWVKYDIYIILFFILVVLMFLLCLLMTMQVLFSNPSSKIYRIGVSFVRHFITPLTILLTIPIMELVLMQMKCVDGKVDTIKDGATCWTGIHILYVVLGIVVSILFTFIIFIMITFYFSPFQYRNSTTKISGSKDSLLFITKVIFIVQHLLIKEEYISILILLLLSLLNFSTQYSDPTYNNFILEIFVNARNSAIFWTYFVLFFAKLFYNSAINGTIYLLLFGYPIMMYFSFIYYKKIEGNFNYTAANFNNIKDYMEKTKYIASLFESYIDSGKGLRYGRELENQKNDILLKGIINNHELSCIDEDCPLKKFIENSGNYNIQKMCLLNYMNNYFSLGVKQFPQSRQLLITYIQFNYSKKYNLNSVRTHLAKIQKLSNSLTEDFIVFSMDQDIKRIKNKVTDVNDGSEMEQEVDVISQKYQRLKFLIENSTKLYGEFWGIFATNVTNNLNTVKLYSLGEKLNIYLNEINDLWENQLKSKKIELENQSVAQLYSRFLKEILWNKKRSEEIQKKLNDEHHRHHEAKKVVDDGVHLGNFDYILENQDYVIFANSSEKGQCNVLQCSNSITHLLGFLKKDIIGKPVENLMPSIFIDGHAKMLESHLKKMHTQQNSQRDSFRGIDKKETFFLPKTKMGYIMPLNSRITVYDDNDFSDNFVIKVKMEPKDTKSVYAFYVLTKTDFSVDSISSSALNLGLSMDLLKKYVVKMSVLVRDQDHELNLVEKWKEYENEPKEVTWVFPEMIYPKNDSQRAREDILTELIEKSPKKKILLQINTMCYDNNLLGYVFKFTEINSKKISSDIEKTSNLEIKYNEKREVMFDVLRLGFIRTVLVEERCGLKNLREDFNNDEESEASKKDISKKTKKSDEDLNIIQESSEDEDKKEEQVLSRERLLELQTRDSQGVKNFIFSLPFHGNDVSLERHRPNREKYPVGRPQEPNIRIDVSHFMKTVEEKIKNTPELMKRLREGNKDDASNQALANAAGANNNLQSQQNAPVEKTAEELSREFSSDTSSSLANIFNAKSITYIKGTSGVIFGVICAMMTLEFVLTYIHIKKIKSYTHYMDNGYKLLNNILYTKYFMTEAILVNTIDCYFGMTKSEQEEYMSKMKSELSSYRSEFVDVYNCYSNASVKFNKDYTNYTENGQVNIKTISNGYESEKLEPFSTAMNRIPTCVFYVSTSTDSSTNSMTMQERNSFELMQNLLNSYYNSWGKATKFLVDNTKQQCSKSSGSIIIFTLSFIITLIFLVLFWKIMAIFIEDREKPINLFLTIKKTIFEDLKNSSEGFSNKLLNKFFGNEDNDEESQQDYQANIKPTDINIIKFKSPNEYKSSVNKDRTHLLNYLKLVMFFVIFLAYMIFKFLYSLQNIRNMEKFVNVFNITQFCQTDTIANVDVVKSYLFNKSIDIYEQKNSTQIFLDTYKSISNNFENMIIETSRTDSFLGGEYKINFRNYINYDFNAIISKPENDDKEFYDQGLKKNILREFEIIRYLSLMNITGNETEQINNTKYCPILNNTLWVEMNHLVENIIRPWFIGIINTMNNEFFNYYDEAQLVHIAVYISLLVVIVLLYCIVWRTYEESLKVLLRISFDLINLIPEEIKYLIVTKLNE